MILGHRVAGAQLVESGLVLFEATSLAGLELHAAKPLFQLLDNVRHAEKVAPTGDVGLSPAGKARALALAKALSGARVRMVLAPPLRRTGQTAAPTA
ncbi:MAG: histidine phosphatase family protein, partial [candidate division NC10 bacterium]